MKKIFILSIICFIMSGCSKKEKFTFCEGVDIQGKGVSCGKKFTTGDLTGVIKDNKPFETEMLEVRVLRIEKNSRTPEKTIHLKVDRTKNTASVPLSFYNSGRYTVEVYKDKDKLAEGGIEVTDIL
jgi:cytochrome c556